MSFSGQQTARVTDGALHNHWRLWRGLLLLCFACSVPVTGAWADEPAQAGLVVVMEEGRVETRCVALERDGISGAELLARSGLSTIVDPASGMGLIVCQIEELGCAHPAEPCFCQCMGGGECIYWNYFFRDPGQGEWTYSGLGAAMHQVKAGSVDAWVWGDGSVPPSAELDFETICVPASPMPSETPTAPPTVPPLPTIALTATAAGTELATEPTPVAVLVTATPPDPSPSSQATATATPPTATPTPVAGDQGLAGLWPFGLVILGMAAVGGILWLRRR